MAMLFEAAFSKYSNRPKLSKIHIKIAWLKGVGTGPIFWVYFPFDTTNVSNYATQLHKNNNNDE